MPPKSRFDWSDEAALAAFIAERSLAQISVAIEGEVLCAHAPLALHDDGSIRFHLARVNRLVPLLDGRPVLAVVVGDHGYISPDWYGTDDQVPTWNYRLAEIRGIARRLDRGEMIEQLDTLSAAQEAALLPKRPWTSAKMDAGRLDTMTRAIVGFAIDRPALQGYAKLGQNKTEAERTGAIAALRMLGRDGIADDMEQL